MVKKRGNINRLLDPRWVSSSSTEWRLWDRQGRLWELAGAHPDRDRVQQLYFDVQVPVAVQEGGGTLDWVEAADRQRRWPSLAARAFNEAWTPPREAPGALPFAVLEFRSADDRLLLFHDFD